MANTRYDQLTMYVLPEVQGCSDPLAEQAIRDAVIEFCQRAMVWVHMADVQSVTAGQAVYDIEPPTGASLVHIKSVKLNGKTLDPLSIDQLDDRYPQWRTESGDPKAYTQVEDAEFILAPVPADTAANGLDVVLVVQPSRSSSAFPGWINDRYQDAILAGAKSRLMLKQNTNWSNPQQGLLYKTEFDRAVSSAKESSTLSFVRTALRTTSRH